MTFLVFTCLLLAHDEPDIGPPPAPAEALAGIKRDYENFTKKWADDYKAAKEDDRNKLFQARRDEGQAAAKRALKLAQDHPDDAAAFDALEWVITGGLGYSEVTWEAMDLVARRYLASPKLGRICQHARIYRLNYTDTENFLRAVLEKNPHREVRGIACISLAAVLHDYSMSAKSLRDPELAKQWQNSEFAKLADKLKARDPDKLLHESEAFYQRTIDQYADVKPEGWTQPLRQRAEATLFKLHHLQVGQVAPEIEGEDIDGKRFKLSDYRGKVVVLDFWGHW